MLKLPSCNFHIYSTYRHTLYHYRAAFPLGPNSTKVGRWHSSVNETPICTENKQKLARRPCRIPTNLARVIIIMLGVAFCTAHRYLNTNLRHAKIIKKQSPTGTNTPIKRRRPDSSRPTPLSPTPRPAPFWASSGVTGVTHWEFVFTLYSPSFLFDFCFVALCSFVYIWALGENNFTGLSVT